MKKYIRFFLQPIISRHFKQKLLQNFHTLTPGEMTIYFIFFRPFWSKERRFFFEGSLGLLGQMYTAERKALYETVLVSKPRQCFEIGTFTGGGSTFFLSSALSKNGTGTLVTMENDTHYYTKAKGYYENRLPALAKHITFVFNETPTAFNAYILPDKKVDCVFFDGAEDSKETLEQYRYFEPYFKTGSIIMFHDWNTEKSVAVKPVITNNLRWEQLVELAPPTSVGFAVFRHR